MRDEENREPEEEIEVEEEVEEVKEEEVEEVKEVEEPPVEEDKRPPVEEDKRPPVEEDKRGGPPFLSSLFFSTLFSSTGALLSTRFSTLFFSAGARPAGLFTPAAPDVFLPPLSSSPVIFCFSKAFFTLASNGTESHILSPPSTLSLNNKNACLEYSLASASPSPIPATIFFNNNALPSSPTPSSPFTTSNFFIIILRI